MGISTISRGDRLLKVQGGKYLVHTEGNETHEALQPLVSNHIKQRFGYDVEPGEIHFRGKRLRRRFEKLTEECGPSTLRSHWSVVQESTGQTSREHIPEAILLA